MKLPKHVNLIEVGPRDGLQNECKTIPTALKISFINQLSKTGLRAIETTSFVSPKWVPQMADHHEVMQSITRNPSVTYMALVPNEQGFKNAISVKTPCISVFTAASETFSMKNTNCTIQQSLERISKIVRQAQQFNLPVRAYISCVLGCPYEGDIAPEVVAALSEKLIQLGCYQVSLGDTIGTGTPLKTQILLKILKEKIPLEKLALHFHDTYAQALTNIYIALEEGITNFDSSVAGLGGCPYAPGAGGNVATEDVIYFLQGLNIETGVNLNSVAEAGWLICDYLKQAPRSKVSLALKSRQNDS